MLNMDISVDAIEPIGAILRNKMYDNRVRRLSIKRYVERYVRRLFGG